MKVALAQLNPVVGDVAGNAAKVIDAINHAREAGADLVVAPELAVSGYPPRDLLLGAGFVDACARTAKDIGENATDGITLVMGTPLPVDAGPGRGQTPGVANSLVVYRDGKLVDYYDKRLLPTYDVFDEDRYFVAGERAVVVDVAGRRVGLAVCEDLWRGEDAGFASRYAGEPDPVDELVRAGAEIVVAPSASPYVVGKAARHEALLRGHAERHNVWVCSVNQVGGNDDLVFDGHSSVFAPGGRLVAAGPGFEETLLVADLADDAPEAADVVADTPVERMAWDALTLGVRDYVHKCGFARTLIGLSGGIDIALTAAIAARALGAENVLGVSMPGPYSSEGSVSDAFDLAERLGMRCVKAPIGAPMEGFTGVLDGVFNGLGEPQLGASLPDLTLENLQSRTRGTLMMALSKRNGALVLTTGNKSELAVGYCTLYGDMNGGLAVLSDVPKTMVYELSRYANAHAGELGFDREPIPRSTIEKPPSAELAPDEKDSDSLPDYAMLDRIVALHVEHQRTPREIEAETGFEPEVVERVCRLIDRNEYKRQQMAVGLKLTSRAFGPGRRMPIAWRRSL